MKRTGIPVISIAVLLWCANVQADSIYLKNGEVIDGEVVAESDGILTVREKFEGMGYGESDYRLEDIEHIEKDIPLTAKSVSKNLDEATIADLESYFQSAFGDHSPITAIRFNEGILNIRYYFSSLDDQDGDRRAVKDNIYKVLDIILNNKIDELSQVNIKASAITPKRNGILSNASVTVYQLKKYDGKPEQLLVEEMKEFTFNDAFYIAP